MQQTQSGSTTVEVCKNARSVARILLTVHARALGSNSTDCMLDAALQQGVRLTWADITEARQRRDADEKKAVQTALDEENCVP